MNLSAVPEEYRTLVEEKLASGAFASLEEILRDALRLWGEREQLFAGHRAEVRAQIAEGVAQAERGELRDGEEAMADVRRRMDERRKGQ